MMSPRENTYLVYLVNICLFFSSALCSCEQKNPIITLEQDMLILSYNDTLFNSTGFVYSNGEKILICDEQNEFIAIADSNMKNLKIIAIAGRGPNEYPSVSIPCILTTENSVFIPYKENLIEYDWNGNRLFNRSFQSIANKVDFSCMCMGCDRNIIFKTLPISGNKTNFVSQDIETGQYHFFHENKSLNKLKNKRNMKMCFLDNGLFLAIEYDNMAKKGKLHVFSLLDETMDREINIPFNQDLLQILQISPDVPAFDGIFGHKNRCYIAFNAFGLITTQFDSFGYNDQWHFLDYPDKLEDHVILENFCVTDKNLIFFNQGFLRFYKNPFK